MTLLKTAALAFALIGSAPIAHAQIENPQGTGYVGLLAGYADTTNIDATVGYGVTAGMMFANGWNGSVFAFNSVSEVSGADVTLLQYGFGVDYSLKGLIGDRLGMMRGGLKIGSSTVDIDTPGTESNTEFAFGPSLGADWMVAEAFSVGGEADLLFVTTDAGYSTLYLFLTGKYWF